MGYASLHECVTDLQRRKMLAVVNVEVDAELEAAAVVRRVYRAGGPAILFTRCRNSQFPLLGNLFGTVDRTRYIFRDALDGVKRLTEARAHLASAVGRPWQSWKILPALWNAVPFFVPARRAHVLQRRIQVSDLPRLRTWPLDGGAYITLPQVYTEHPDRPGWMHSNLGMYRIQLSGNEYRPDREIGLHYQIHRGIGVHHAAALRRGERLRVHIFVGGPPALTVAAVMPLPEGVPEIAFAGALGGRHVRLARFSDGLPVFADADFCIVGNVDMDRNLPEGPFGDHLGYYSLAHPFPVLEVEAVYHRPNAIWPFTTVGRPPQEDTTFGELVHELTGPAIPAVMPGIHAVHAVDAAGVHPLLLAIGSERYTPYETLQEPRELLTQANALLGQGQLSLAKYLLIVAREDDTTLDVRNVRAFLQHLLLRVDLSRDLHFQTSTTIDTLDYSGHALHRGSKLVVAGVGPPRRSLSGELPANLNMPTQFQTAQVCLPGVLAVSAPPHGGKLDADGRDKHMAALCKSLAHLPTHPLVVVVDDSEFVASSLENFLWTTFTRSNPAADVHGVAAFMREKHWGCGGPLIVDARAKSHHAPALEEDADVVRRVESLAVRGGPLHGLF